MALPYPSPFFLAMILTLLSMGVMSGVQAKPVERTDPKLDITSSIKIGRPLFGERLGPFTVGQELTLTCSTEASESVSLSWWEGHTEQKASVEEDKGITSSSFTIKTLRTEDDGRRFVCRDEETLTTKTIELIILPVPVLDITSSIEMGQPILGGTVGPFTAGQQLTLTCSSGVAGSVSLSWWEGDTEQESSVKEAEGIISSSFTIQTLRIEDNERRFTCRDGETQIVKSIQIRINTDTLEIIKAGFDITEGEVLKGIAGEDFIINCIVLGYNPIAVSWWEDGAELESVASASPYAKNSVLSLKALTVDDSGRSFTCRSLNGQLSKTFILDVNDEIATVVEGRPGYLIPLVVVLVVVLIVTATAVVMVICLRKKKFTSEGTNHSASNNYAAGGAACDALSGKMFSKKSCGGNVEHPDATDAARLIESV